MTRERGFTLLEVLVALAILAIGVMAAMRALTMVTLAAADVRDRQLATWVAQNRLAEIRAQSVFPPLGNGEGQVVQAGQSFRWRQAVTTTPNPLFRRVDVRVFADTNESALAHLSGFAVQPLR